jgi:hypothetical protein
MPPIRTTIIDAEWSDCLIRLRDARALILRDSESFHEAAMTLERVGQVLCGKMRKGLGAYEPELIELATSSQTQDLCEVARLFETVREARNMAVHEGAWARHLSSRLIDLMLILEHAIASKMKLVKDIMVQTPVVAQDWHLIAHVRQTMLANSFSSLPIFQNEKWFIVTDVMVVRYLRGAADKKELADRLSTSLGTAIGHGAIAPTEATCVPPDAKLAELDSAIDQSLILITEEALDGSRLLGILSPFDLL